MMKKLRIWLIRKLGGMLMDDLPPILQAQYLNYLLNKTLDNRARDIFLYDSFPTV